jgi:acetyl esterase
MTLDPAGGTGLAGRLAVLGRLRTRLQAGPRSGPGTARPNRDESGPDPATSAVPAPDASPARRRSPDPSTRLILSLVNRRTQGGRMPANIADLRAFADRQVLPRWLPRLQLAAVQDSSIPGPESELPIRVYRPRGAVRGVVLFLHGGGFVHCGLDSHDGICCRLASGSGAVVVSLAYRLAPEHRFPAAPQDGYAALHWIAANSEALDADGSRIAVAGDSAGGNLAAVVAQMARDQGGPAIAHQVLFYPPTHGLEDVPSRHENGSGYFLTTDLMRWYLDQYIDAGHHYTSPYFAPCLASDLSGLPPATIITAEFDPLRDEGARYAEKLRAAGVPVDYRCYPGTIHAFLSFYPVQSKARDALAVAGAAIRAAFGRTAADAPAGALPSTSPDLVADGPRESWPKGGWPKGGWPKGGWPGVRGWWGGRAHSERLDERSGAGVSIEPDGPHP